MWNKDWVFALVLICVTLAAYQPAWNGKPIWDDDAHLTRPELRSMDGLLRIWIEPGATQQYYPLVHSAFWLEEKIWGMAPLGYHLVNILLHALAALLFLRILRQLRIPGGRLAAAIFALHPVMVESVAWISELKNTLSAVFYLGAALAYLRFDRTRSGMPPATAPERKGNQETGARLSYDFALVLFLLGLASKTVVATLPAALLIVFWWERGKLSFQRDVCPLLPFFLAGIGAGLFTVWMERHFIGANGAPFRFTLVERFLIAGRDIWFYLGKLFWPADLMFIYPRWQVTQSAGWQYLFPAAGVGLLGVLWAGRKRWRGPLAALLFFAATLFPALGFFNVFPFVFSLVADHFQYLASLGIITLASAAAALLWESRHWRAGGVLSAALPVMLGCLTWRQCAMYSDMETLWRTTIKQNPGCAMAYNNLGYLLYHEARKEEAFPDFQKALSLDPGDTEAHFNLGNSLFDQGRVGEAIAEYETAIKQQPGFVSARINLGAAFLRTNREREGAEQFELALKADPKSAVSHFNLGNLLLREGRVDGAIFHYEKTLETKPDMTEASVNLSAAFLAQGRVNEAIDTLQKALKLAEAAGNAAAAGRIKARIERCQKMSPPAAASANRP